MKVLIYGGSGFLGRNLANYLNKKKHKVTVFDKKKIYFDKKNIKFIKGDILNLSQVQKATKGQDIVYNLAGISDIGDSIKNPISTSRLGFRENMAFIMGISCFYLKKNITNWQSGINSK